MSAVRDYRRRAQASDQWSRHAAVLGDADRAEQFQRLAAYWHRQAARERSRIATGAAAFMAGAAFWGGVAWFLGWLG